MTIRTIIIEAALLFVELVTCAYSATPDQLSRWGYPEGTVQYVGQYATAYDGRTRCPRWSIEYLTADTCKGPAVRHNTWRSYKSVPLELRVTRQDFSSLDWVIGHAVPADDFGEQEARDATFALGLNTFPQNGPLNGGLWRQLEQDAQPKVDGVEVWICTMPLWLTKGSAVRFETIGDREVWVPNYLSKCVVKLFPGEEKPKRVDCWLVPNRRPEAGSRLDEFSVSLKVLRQESGLMVFEKLEADP